MKKNEDGKGKTKKRVVSITELSAGGVVVKRINNKVHIALLRTEHARGDAWVLPKGHIELQLGETEEQAALREVKEELGISKVLLKRPLGSTKYSFFTERGRISKTVYYFLIESQDEELHPQTEEGLLEAKWHSVREALKKITYPTDREVILKAVASGKNRNRQSRNDVS